MNKVYHSRVYTDRPEYADYDAPHKFQAIQGIVARRLREHPNAICSYSGGSDSDILIDVIERTRDIFHLPPVKLDGEPAELYRMMEDKSLPEPVVQDWGLD